MIKYHTDDKINQKPKIELSCTKQVGLMQDFFSGDEDDVCAAIDIPQSVSCSSESRGVPCVHASVIAGLTRIHSRFKYPFCTISRVFCTVDHIH